MTNPRHGSRGKWLRKLIPALTLTTNASVVKVDTETDTVAASIDIQGDRPLAFPIGVTLSPDDTRL
jgi:hypothetical protein